MLTNGLQDKPKARTSQQDKLKMKEYIRNGDPDDIKDILKIRFHMLGVKKLPKK